MSVILCDMMTRLFLGPPKIHLHVTAKLSRQSPLILRAGLSALKELHKPQGSQLHLAQGHNGRLGRLHRSSLVGR